MSGSGVRGVDHDQVAGHHVAQLREAVEAGGVALGEDADGLVALDHDHGAVGALVDQRERLADRARRRQGDRRVVDGVARLHVLDHLVDDVEGDVLGQDRHAAPAGDGLGHPPAGDGGHVGDHDRQAGPDPVRRRQVDVHAGRHGRQARHHEDVAVRQVVGRWGVVQEAHGRSCPSRARSGRSMLRPPGAIGAVARPALPSIVSERSEPTARAAGSGQRECPGPARPRLGLVVRADVGRHRGQRAARGRRADGHRRRPARPRRRAEAPRPGGLRRPHRAAGRRPARRGSRSTPSASRSAPARCWSWRRRSRSASTGSCSPASATARSRGTRRTPTA